MHEAVTNRSVHPSVVEYPSSDGKPMAETDLHFDRITYAANALKIRYAATPNVYVGANMLVYDEPGNPRRSLAPDVFVVFGVPKHRRDVFKIWEEKPPSFVLEITSRSTRREDTDAKRRRYAAWGVDEYFLYDPRGEYLAPPLVGLSLRQGRYRSMSPVRLRNGEHGYRSDTLGLHLWLKESELRLFDPVSKRELPTQAEAECAWGDEAIARANAENARDKAEAARDKAEARLEDEVAARTAAEAARTAAEAEAADLRARLSEITGK